MLETVPWVFLSFSSLLVFLVENDWVAKRQMGVKFRPTSNQPVRRQSKSSLKKSLVPQIIPNLLEPCCAPLKPRWFDPDSFDTPNKWYPDRKKTTRLGTWAKMESLMPQSPIFSLLQRPLPGGFSLRPREMMLSFGHEVKGCKSFSVVPIFEKCMFSFSIVFC